MNCFTERMNETEFNFENIQFCQIYYNYLNIELFL